MLDQGTLQSEKLHYWRNGYVVVRDPDGHAIRAVTR